MIPYDQGFSVLTDLIPGISISGCYISNKKWVPVGGIGEGEDYKFNSKYSSFSSLAKQFINFIVNLYLFTLLFLVHFHPIFPSAIEQVNVAISEQKLSKIIGSEFLFVGG